MQNHKVVLCFSMLIMLLLYCLLFYYRSTFSVGSLPPLPSTDDSLYGGSTTSSRPLQSTEVSFTISTSSMSSQTTSFASPDILTTFSSTPSTPAPPSSTKTVLYWGRYFDMEWPNPHDVLCSGGYRCRLTNNPNEYLTSDAVVFHGRSEVRGFPDLKQRPLGQVWVYYSQEPPPHMFFGRFFIDIPNIMNMVLSYIRKSDALASYGYIVPGKFQKGFDPDKNYLENKTKTAVAMISNCVGHRMQFIKMLQKYIDVDIMGGCGGRTICKSCWEELRKTYKFYLSFENNYCLDYITEKFYDNGLSHGMVPVTLNAANMSNPAVAPPGSFIDASKFTSAKALADFLQAEGSDSEHYNKYFKWHSEYTVVYGDQGNYDCNLCIALHNQNQKPLKTYQNVDKWYEENSKCSTYPTLSL